MCKGVNKSNCKNFGATAKDRLASWLEPWASHAGQQRVTAAPQERTGRGAGQKKRATRRRSVQTSATGCRFRGKTALSRKGSVHLGTGIAGPWPSSSKIRKKQGSARKRCRGGGKSDSSKEKERRWRRSCRADHRVLAISRRRQESWRIMRA